MSDFRDDLNDILKGINPQTKVEVRQTTPTDAVKIDLRDEQVGSLPVTQEQVAPYLADPSLRSCSVFIDGDLVFVGGCAPKWGKTASGWLLVDKTFPQKIQKYKHEFLIAFRAYLDIMPFERVETGCLDGFNQGQKFLEYLGFVKEGLMRKSGPDRKDYWSYAYIKELK